MFKRGLYPFKSINRSRAYRYNMPAAMKNWGLLSSDVKVDFSKVQEWKGNVVKKLTSGVEGLLKGNKVDIVKGEAYFVDSHTVKVMDEKSSQTYKFNNCIIATGSKTD